MRLVAPLDVHDSVIEEVAKALAWSKLTPKGLETCDWMTDFAECERAEFRATARAAIAAALDHIKR